MSMSFLNYVVQKSSQIVKSIYFKNVLVLGRENIPLDGPIIICGNHANQFIDPILIAAIIDRDLSFTIAASSFSKPIVGQLAKLLKAIPVKRPEDGKVKGKGTIIIKDNKIEGTNTEFLIQENNIGKGWSLLIGKTTVVISKIIDDLNLEIVKNKDLNELEQNKEYEYFVSLFLNLSIYQN